MSTDWLRLFHKIRTADLIEFQHALGDDGWKQIGPHTPLAEILPTIEFKKSVLIRETEELTVHLTPDHLQSPAARTHFYILMAAAEVGAASVVESLMEREVIENHFKRIDGQSHEGKNWRRFEDARKSDDSVRVVQFMYFWQIQEIVESERERLRHAFDLEKYIKDLELITDLRNDVMHPLTPLASAYRGVSLSQIAQAAERVAMGDVREHYPLEN